VRASLRDTHFFALAVVTFHYVTTLAVVTWRCDVTTIVVTSQQSLWHGLKWSVYWHENLIFLKTCPNGSSDSSKNSL